MRFVVSLAGLSIVLFGCATPSTKPIQIDESANQAEMKLQHELALEGLINDDLRLQKVAFDLKVKSAGLCGQLVNYDLGIYALDQDMVPKEMREAAKTLYHIEQRPRILAIYPGSGGEEAGLLPGDEIISINQWVIPHGENSPKLVAEKIRELLKDGKPLSLQIARGSEETNITITPKKECAFPVILHGSDELNAFADGKNVFITRGMMRFTQDDTELALVVSHEMSHNSMEHMKAKRSNYIFGTLLDILITATTGANTQGAFGNIAASAYSKEFEAEADYVGMYMMAAAGRDMDSAPKFWRRLAAAHPSGIQANYSSTHPSSAYRLLALEQTVKEIKGKAASGAALTPDLKQPATAQASAGTGSAAPPATQAMAQSMQFSDAVEGAWGGKEIQTTGLAGLVKGVGIKLTLKNLTEKEITRVEGRIKLSEVAGQEIGAITFRSHKRIPAHESIEVAQNVYPIIFSGYAKLKELEQEKIGAEFIFETVEFIDGSRITRPQ